MNKNVVKISREDSLEIELSHAREALQSIYESSSLEEIHNIVYIAADKMSNGSPENLLKSIKN